MTDARAFAYDEVRYDTGAQEQTRPALLQTMAALHGVRAASPARCRYLELGGGSGVNVMPLAAAYPESDFVVVDLAASAIATGKKLVGEMDLDNVTLIQGDVTTPLEIGAFDYVVAHGVYSWIPDAVRTHLLAAARRHLAPAGVFYLSYNAQPGWHVVGVLRDLMERHVRGETSPAVRVNRAMALVERVAALEGTTGFTAALRETASSFLRSVARAKRPEDEFNHFVFHDALAETNDAFYVRDVAERAERHGLRWFGSAAHARVEARETFDALAQSLHGKTTLPVERAALYAAQFDDAMAGTRFRRDLFVRADLAGARDLDAAVADALYATWRGAPPTTLLDGRLVRSDDADLSELATSAFGVSALAAVRAAFPASMRVGDIAGERPAMLFDLLRAWGARVIDLSVEPPRFARRIARAPRASAFVRAAARRTVATALGEPCNVVNAFHETYVFPPEYAAVIERLDGAHDRRALAEAAGGGARAAQLVDVVLDELFGVAALLD